MLFYEYEWVCLFATAFDYLLHVQSTRCVLLQRVITCSECYLPIDRFPPKVLLVILQRVYIYIYAEFKRERETCDLLRDHVTLSEMSITCVLTSVICSSMGGWRNWLWCCSTALKKSSTLWQGAAKETSLKGQLRNYSPATKTSGLTIASFDYLYQIQSDLESLHRSSSTFFQSKIPVLDFRLTQK